MDQIWAKPKFLAKRANFESRDPETLGHNTFLKVITTVSAYMKLLEPTPVTKWVKWTKFGPQFGQKCISGNTVDLQSLNKCSFMMSDKCISHFKML